MKTRKFIAIAAPNPGLLMQLQSGPWNCFETKIGSKTQIE